MGFTTKNQETKRRTWHCRTDAGNFIDKFSKEQGWDKADVINRAIMYYANEYYNGELDDPMVQNKMKESVNENLTDGESGRLRDMFNRGNKK
jgi:hypothetical protein